MTAATDEGAPVDITAARAQHLISAAYQLPTAKRTAWLHDQCTGDPALRREVAWLLDALRAPEDTFLEHAPRAVLDAGVPAALTVPQPRDYRIIRPIGIGGMGTVYLAERVDDDYVQQVALKFLNSVALANPVAVARFVDERRILAQLSHPNIAQLVDGGTLGDGRPFIAMAYVDGTRVDRYADDARLDQRARLALFLRICSGVQYAHERLVIHRDIKPANILVGVDGEPKLLDFGIARLIDRPDGDETRTGAGQRMMTLAYASPEQIRGDALGTATDVYSLGVLLYELLCGARPWRDDLSATELARQIAETDPVAPSVAARRTGQPRSIGADLDAIILKALRKEPAQRYGSVREFADDIRRFLASHPVLARRGHRAYRLRKFVARHRVGVGAALLLVVTVVAFLWSRERQLDEVRRQRVMADQVATFMIDGFVLLDPGDAQGRDVTARDVLDNAFRRIDDVPDVDVQLRLVEAVSRAYGNIGAFDRALAASEKAVALYRAAGRTDTIGYANVLAKLGVARVRGGVSTRGRVEIEEALARFERLGVTSGVPLANALNEKAKLLLEDGAAPDAMIATFSRAIAAAADVPATATRLRLDRATWHYLRGDLDAAERDAAAVVDEAVAAGEGTHPRVPVGRRILVWVMTARGQHDAAREMARQNLAAVERLFGDDGLPYAEFLLALAEAHVAAGDAIEGERLLRRTLAIHRAPGNDVDPGGRVRTENDLVDVLLALGRTDDAIAQARDLIAFCRDDVGDTHFYCGGAWSSLGHALHAAGRDEAARAAFVGAADRLALSGSAVADARAAAWRGAAITSLALGDADAARSQADAASRAFAAMTSPPAAGIAAVDDVVFATAIAVGAPLARERHEARYADVVALDGECGERALAMREVARLALRSTPASTMGILAPPSGCAPRRWRSGS